MPRKFALLAVAAFALAVLLPSSALAFSFGPPQTRLAGLDFQQMQGIAAADVNGDGLQDAVVDGYNPGVGGGDPVVAVMLGRANGSLGPATNYPMPGAGPLIGIATGDFNGDGSPDLVMGSPFVGAVVISLNDGEGGFEAPTSPGGSFSPEGFFVDDFNGDGNLDIASANGGSYSVFLGHGDGTFAPPVNEETEEWALNLTGGDFNDDGIVDLALGNIDNSTVRILLGDGEGAFTEATAVDLSPLEPDPCGCVESWDIAAGDLNGDGRDDIVVTDRFENRIFSVLSEPDDTFTPLGPFVTGNEGQTISVALGDLNSDGKLDAVTSGYLEDTGTVLTGNGDGTFTSALEVDAGPTPDDNAIADINGDGKLDLLFSDQDGNFDGGKATLLLNTGLPAAEAGPASIDFGDQAQQTVSTPQAVTVTNEGDALLHVTDVALAGADADDFMASSDTCTAAPVLAGASCTIAVRFIPSAAGTRAATLQVFSASPASPASIALEGNGTDLPTGPTGAQGPTGYGAPGPAGPRGPKGPRAPLVLALAQKQLRAHVGKRIQFSFATTQPGQATLKVSPGGMTVKRSLSAAGTGTLALKLGKKGQYKLHLAFRASDGQQRSADAKLTVTPTSG